MLIRDGRVIDVIGRAFMENVPTVTYWGFGGWYDAVDLMAENEEDAKCKALEAIAKAGEGNDG